MIHFGVTGRHPVSQRFFFDSSTLYDYSSMFLFLHQCSANILLAKSEKDSNPVSNPCQPSFSFPVMTKRKKKETQHYDCRSFPFCLDLFCFPLSSSPFFLSLHLLLVCAFSSFPWHPSVFLQVSQVSQYLELSTKKLPFKNINLEETCIISYLPPFLGLYRALHYIQHSTACYLHDSSHKNWVKVATYPLCVQIGRDPNFQGTPALQDPGVAELRKNDRIFVDSGCLSFSSCATVFLSSEWLLLTIKGLSADQWSVYGSDGHMRRNASGVRKDVCSGGRGSGWATVTDTFPWMWKWT